MVVIKEHLEDLQQSGYFITRHSFMEKNQNRSERLKPEVHLRWLNTVLAVSEYKSFAKLWQEKGCSSQAET